MFGTKVTNLDILLSGQNGHKWHFGHSGQSEVSGNGTIGFPMYKNIVIDLLSVSGTCEGGQTGIALPEMDGL